MYSGLRRQFYTLKFQITEKGEIFYNGETEGGDSGSPIFLVESDDGLKGYPVGIHTTKLNKTTFKEQARKGVYFNETNIRKINYHM